MPQSIDSKDRAIIYQLDLDARQSVSRLSKKVKLNRRVVCYRIERMQKQGILQKFLLFVNIPKTGYIVTTIFSRFHDTQLKDEEVIIDYLKKKKQVGWLASMDGRFHVGFSIYCKNIKEATEFFDEFRDTYGHFLSDIQTANTVMAWRFPRKYLCDGDCEEKGSPPKDAAFKLEELDQTDRKILAALGEDARMRAVEIARKAGVSADAVADRISKLKGSGVIYRLGIILDNLSLNRRLFRTFITFQNLNKVKEKFLNYCYEHPNAIQLKRMLGSWEWEVDLEVKDETELRRINSEFKEHFKDAVSATSFVTIYKIHKFDMGGFLLD